MSDKESGLGKTSARRAFKFTLFYVVIGAVWISAAERAVKFLPISPSTFSHAAIIELWFLAGLAFTAVMFYLLIQRYLERELAAETSRRESEERFERIVETVAEGIVIIGRDGRITFANAAAETILGRSRAEIQAKSVTDPAWKIAAADGRLLAEKDMPFSEVLKIKQPVQGVVLSLESPAGKRISLSINAAPILDAAGEAAIVVASFENNTERLAGETSLRE